jgi:DNA-binding response OmpR family regulator
MSADKTILIAEDNDDLAFLYQQYLADTYRVRSAQTGREAIRSATPAVDLIILDYKLPDMLGTDVRDQLRVRRVARAGEKMRVSVLSVACTSARHVMRHSTPT